VYAGAYNDGELYALAPGDRTSGRMRPYASFAGGITDVTAGPDGRLYVATSDAVWTIEPAARGTAATSPNSPTTLAPGASVTASPPDGDTSDGRPWVAAVAAVVLAVGLGVRFAAGRRLRADARDDD
jgi:hypothetical protein